MKDEITNRVIELAVAIQQIPAPTFEEGRRAEFVRALFVQEALQDVSQDAVGNVYARLAGQGAARPLVVSAHLDTVFPRDTKLDVRREAGRIYAPGLGDNALGVAALFGLAWQLRARGTSLPGDVWLVANVCEEGLGDLRGMRAVVERFGVQALAYLVIEGLSLGFIQHRGLGVRRYRIEAHTRGGHSWSDYGQPSAVHELAHLVTQLTALSLPEQPRTTLNVGRMGGGTSVNVIAPDAWLELDLRSENSPMLEELARQVEALVEAASRPGVRFEARVIGQRPPGELPSDHALIRLAQDCLQEQGMDAQLTIGSTDANIPLSRGLPALVLGVTRGGGAHTLEEFIETTGVSQGLEQLAEFVTRAFAIHSKVPWR
ncbi:MAG: M20/M25/M40 family metallo-hydrolase [Anaerolineales bacterium]